MQSPILLGLAAGAAGTVALNVATYVDMAVRGRGASDVPADLAGKLAGALGLSLEAGAEASEPAKTAAANRRSGVGALLGYAVGLGTGAAYALVRQRLGDKPAVPLAGAAVGLTAMALSDVPAIAAGATNPAEWGPAGWLADLLPHLAYGLTTAVALDALAE